MMNSPALLWWSLGIETPREAPSVAVDWRTILVHIRLVRRFECHSQFHSKLRVWIRLAYITSMLVFQTS